MGNWSSASNVRRVHLKTFGWGSVWVPQTKTREQIHINIYIYIKVFGVKGVKILTHVRPSSVLYNLMFMVPYILAKCICDWKSNEMHMDLYVFFISLYLFYMFRVLFEPITRSTNCRLQPYVCAIVMLCEKLDNPLEQVLAGTPQPKTNKYTNYSFSLLIMYGSSYMFRHYIVIFRERSQCLMRDAQLRSSRL
jgi:hypothetical protein